MTDVSRSALPPAGGDAPAVPAAHEDFIGGRWTPPADGRYFESEDPSTGEHLTRHGREKGTIALHEYTRVKSVIARCRRPTTR